MDKQLTQYLNEMKAELQELYENLDSEIRATDNDTLIDDSYRGVVSKLESALGEMDGLINDMESGMYDKYTDMLEADD